ncbi:UNVERIFIED_CONTAM: hypothetical protein Sangu_0050400 [Sesamum angustifolium]|uniref:Uncharacterized protein n=1 Tax=Sesamum angustifolium TaxID=2727405 RepID=A0AAW2RKB6_9LAMI
MATIEVLECCNCNDLLSMWPNGVSLQHLSHLRRLVVADCSMFVSLGEEELQLPCNLEILELFRCASLTSLPTDLGNLSCKALESLPRDISNLERLEIKECPSLTNWSAGAKLFTSLLNCNLSHCSGLEYFPEQGLPPYLRSLSVEHCSNLRALPMQIRNMLSIISLEIGSCRRLKTFPKCDFPPNLSSLRIWDSRKLKPLSHWGLHRLTSLREFSICGGFQELQLLAADCGLFPPSLIKFSVARFPKLSSLSGVLENLTSLQHLSIMNCTSLNVLPSENLLGKLWLLEISDCPLLKQRCLKDKVLKTRLLNVLLSYTADLRLLYVGGSSSWQRLVLEFRLKLLHMSLQTLRLYFTLAADNDSA